MTDARVRPDLHAHTTASDGRLSPAQVALRAKEAGVTLLSVTDHDALEGLPEAAAAAQNAGIGFLPGVEISAGEDSRVHVLGYGVSADMRALSGLLESMRADRENRALEMLSRLCALGMPLPHGEILRGDGTSVGRPRIAREMIRAGYVGSMVEAFEKYLAEGRPAYVPRKKRAAAEVIALLRAEGAVPVLAHPGLLHLDQTAFMPLLAQWKEAGLAGLEVYHPVHPPETLPAWDALARAQGLLVTGGSDFHEPGEGFSPLGCMVNLWPRAGEDAEALRSAVRCFHPSAI